MIVGSGSIAKLLNDRLGFIFFAAGVSDSRLGCLSDRVERIERERKELFNALEQAREFQYMVVYFGTISKFFNESSYIKHKSQMEAMIRELVENFTIINLGNVWECTNPNTFRNAIKRFEADGGTAKINEEYKYMISKEQLNFITDNLPATGKHEISIFGEMVTVKEALAR